MALGDKKTTALVLIRVAVAAIMFIHGAVRISNGTVSEFGSSLGAQGVPLGFYVAWAITLFELIGSVLLAVGSYVWIIALLFAAGVAVTIALVNWKQGWSAGTEFSALLLACLLAIAYASYKKPERSFRNR